MNMKLCRPTEQTYLIIESVHSSDVLRVSEVIQVYRQVIGFCNFEKYLFDGKALQGAPSAWQFVKNYLSGGGRITTSPTGKEGLYSVYRGVRNSFRPIANLNISGNGFTRMLSTEIALGEPMSPFTWGEDPIPDIQLYQRDDVQFTMTGRNPPPTAYAIYDITTGMLADVRNPAERQKLLADLRLATQ